MTGFLPYDPGVLPTRQSPVAGESLVIEVEGLPPTKTIGRSLRNRTHSRFSAFAALRAQALHIMAGRAWYFGEVELSLVLRSPKRVGQDSLLSYVAGIMDTLDGSAGPTFTYLPIVFQDDSQVRGLQSAWEYSELERYSVEIRFK